MRTARVSVPFTPMELSRAGSLQDLCEQFVLAEGPTGPDGWRVEAIGAWTLTCHQTLPRISIVDLRGKKAGWILGYPIDSGGTLLRDGYAVERSEEDDSAAFVDSFGGRFLAILADGESPAVYPDACGSYSSVYCPDQRVMASTPALIPYTEGTPDWTELIQTLGIPSTNAMYPVGLTPRKGVFRLLPNHHLDLRNWQAQRHWPVREIQGVGDLEESLVRIVEITRRQIEAVAREYPCYLPFTAGRDSRMLLACARAIAGNLSYYTIELPDAGGETDCRVAERIARRMRLRHETVTMRPPRQNDLIEWAFRTGCSVGAVRGWEAATTYKALKRDHVHLLGNVGELARGFYWRPNDREDSQILPERLSQICCPGESEIILGKVSGWLSEAPVADSLQLLDLFYLEQRMGCWAGVFPYAEYAGPGFDLFPMCHREVVALMMALPSQARRDGSLMEAVIRREWPELLAWPFNRAPAGLRAKRFQRRIRRGLRRRVVRLLSRHRSG